MVGAVLVREGWRAASGRPGRANGLKSGVKTTAQLIKTTGSGIKTRAPGILTGLKPPPQEY